MASPIGALPDDSSGSCWSTWGQTGASLIEAIAVRECAMGDEEGPEYEYEYEEPGQLTESDQEFAADFALDPDKYLDKCKNNGHLSRQLARVGYRLTAVDVAKDMRKATFINVLARTGLVSRAAAAAGWSTGVAFAVRKSDAKFASLWDDALEFACDEAEEEARRRAIYGVRKAVYQQGRLVGHETVYSDRLLEVILTGRRRDVYGKRVDLAAEVKGGVLVVPAPRTAPDWEAGASATQAQHREMRTIEHVNVGPKK